MPNASPNQTPADIMARIISAGVNRYVESLPDFARDFSAEPERTTPEPNLTRTKTGAIPRLLLSPAL